MNKPTRIAAITAINSNWIGMVDDGDLGRLIRSGSFKDLYNEVKELEKLGRSVTWKRGVEKWLECIDEAWQCFVSDNGISDDERYRLFGEENTYFGGETRKEWITLIKWALMQGSTFAYLAA